jgi:hypothetical protein
MLCTEVARTQDDARQKKLRAATARATTTKGVALLPPMLEPSPTAREEIFEPPVDYAAVHSPCVSP